MISDQLFDKIFIYKKTKLWKKLWDSQMFAVALSDGRTSYVSVMGRMMEHIALSVYIGEEGLRSNFYMRSQATDADVSLFQEHERLLQQDCLQCIFDEKDMLGEEEAEEVRDYARRHGIRLAGAHAFPQLCKYQPGRYPWRIEAEEDLNAMGEALDAAIDLANRLEKSKPEEIGLTDLLGGERNLLLMKRSDDGFVLDQTELPAISPKPWPKPELKNELGLKRLERLEKEGTWECEMVMVTEAVQTEPDTAPVFPMMLMCVEQESGYAVPVRFVCDLEKEAEELMNNYIEALCGQEFCPEALLARDERTFAFLEDFCRELNISLKIEPELPTLDEMQEDFADALDAGMNPEEDIEDLLTAMMSMGPEALSILPDDIVDELRQIAKEEGCEDTEDDIMSLLSGFLDMVADGKANQGEGGPRPASAELDESYVISVSLGTGCYRHIKIAAGDYLCDLHDAIQEAFGFGNDHLYAFFMDNQMWGRADSYFANGEGSSSVRNVRLCDLGLYKDRKFKYLFDFGDEWRFQCKVLRAEPGAVKSPQIIRSKGTAPKQYGGDFW